MTAVTFFQTGPRRAESIWRPIFAIARPFVLLAALAFFAGFGGYLILGPPQVMNTGGSVPPPAAVGPKPAPATATSAADESAPQWDAPKHV